MLDILNSFIALSTAFKRLVLERLVPQGERLQVFSQRNIETET